MLTVTDVSLQFAGSTLYKHVDLKFAAGNCYGIIGANGAGKSTLLRILSGALEPTTGSVTMGADDRMSVLEQDHFKYDEYNVMDTVIMGNRRLYDIMKEKEALYAKEDFTDADGEKAAELEGEFAEMNGWEAETGGGPAFERFGHSDGPAYRAHVGAGRPPEGEGTAGAGSVRPAVHRAAGRAHQRPGH